MLDKSNKYFFNPVSAGLIRKFWCFIRGNDPNYYYSSFRCNYFLGGVILYNLGVLSYLERYYEFSTLKVLGFKDTQIQKILVQQNIWLSMIGILLGLPVGYLLIEYMISTIQDTMDVINFIALPSYLYAILGTLVISWVISKIISLRIKHIDMVSSLKAND